MSKKKSSFSSLMNCIQKIKENVKSFASSFSKIFGFYLIGFAAFTITSFHFGTIEIISGIAITSYLVLSIAFVKRKKIKKYWWILALLLAFPILTPFFTLNNYSKCGEGFSYLASRRSNCDCDGLKHYLWNTEIYCIGAATQCYLGSQAVPCK